jgi:hypothetical protein
VTTPHGSRAGGFWNDAAVSSHGNSSVHAHQRDRLKTTDVWHGTQNADTFVLLPGGTFYARTPKHDSLVRVQKNYPDILFESQKSGNACSACDSVAFIPAIW